MKESSKWRSGRDVDRVVSICAFGRGRKSADAFSDHEGVTAEDDRDVVVPALKRAAFEVVEPELALEIFVHSLGAPALLDDSNDFFFRHPSAQRGEDELGRLLFAFG